jgi:hypothetical protein
MNKQLLLWGWELAYRCLLSKPNKPAPFRAPLFPRSATKAYTLPGTTTVATRFNWRQSLTGTSTFIKLLVANYVPITGDELLAFPQTVVDINSSFKQNFGY